MRIPFVLAVLQVVVIAGLGAVWVELYGLRSDMRTRVPDPPVSPAAGEIAPVPSIAGPEETAPVLTDDAMRRILREELVAALTEHSVMPARPTEPLHQDQDAPDDAEIGYLRDSLELEIQYYIDRGEISDVEMRVLQQEMIRLPAADRRELLARLVQAMNSGELKGQL